MSSGGDLGPSAQRVLAILRGEGLADAVVVLPESTHTAAMAASALGCEVAQIAKSIVFRASESDRPILVVASGANRIDVKRLAEHVGEPLAKADADFVRRRTGFAIGGVSPVGHTESVETYVDEDLFGHRVIWAAAGSPNAVFRLTPDDAVRLTGGRVVRVK